MIHLAQDLAATSAQSDLMGCSCSKSESRHDVQDRRALPTLLTEPSRKPPELQRAKEVEKFVVSCHASEGSKWLSELVSVSSELKEKLQDPQFVASRCDLDESGDLDPHELKQAARVYGISPGFARQQMAGQSRISNEDFAHMVTRLFLANSRLGIKTIPHSLRGVALGQLVHLEALFVKSGWLPAACESFNMENASAIENGKKFKQSPNLYALDTFVVTPMTKPGKCEAREHDHQRTIADATEKSSFSELVNPCGLWVHCFVSHFWGHDFSSTVTALELWADSNYQKMTSEKSSLVFWICLFALNQHNVAEEVGENPQQGPFNAALAQATGGAVMILDQDIKPFSRIWCLFEISRLKDLRRPFELICSEGSLSQPATGSQAVSIKMLRATCEALWKVGAAKAESSVAADKYQIWFETVDKHMRAVISPFGPQRFFSHFDVSEGFFSDFDRYMQSLLSTAMFQLLVARGEITAAAKCCLYGADVGSEQLREICHSFQHEAERKDWLNNLLMKTSDASAAQLALQLGADAKAVDNNGETALMFAARFGHEAAAKLLLEHGAEVKASRNDGLTALMAAAARGHGTVAQLLLEHRADVNAADNDGWTALTLATSAPRDSLALIGLLRGHGAC